MPRTHISWKRLDRRELDYQSDLRQSQTQSDFDGITGVTRAHDARSTAQQEQSRESESGFPMEKCEQHAVHGGDVMS